MQNPWKHISLDDYENHMQLDSVMQLQAMNEMMKGQFNHYPVSTVLILGIAGGNGLAHISPAKFRRVYGVDINPDYLKACTKRYPGLEGIFYPIEADLLDEALMLPKTELVIANLLIEYIGYECFQRVIRNVEPQYVSCVIQRNTGTDFVSDSPYLSAFDRLSEVHHQMRETELTKTLQEIGYRPVFQLETNLPNGKSLVRLDYQKQYFPE